MRKPSSLKVRLGEHDVSRLSERYGYEELEVQKVVLHESFDNTTLLHDVALLKLVAPAQRRPNIDLVCLPQNQLNINTLISNECYITGWGRQTEGTHVVIRRISF